MEGRVKKYGQLSPERAKVWTEKSPKYHYNHRYNQQLQQQKRNRKVSVVYYLSRNRQLEHPHFMEVSLSSSGELYLRDVIERLNALRGRGMASMYSWSCKRSYKNGYVWHDLSDDDVILPVHGNEYILKGSELFEESNSHGRLIPAETLKLQNRKALPEPPFSRSQEESPSSSSLNGRTRNSSQEDELSPQSNVAKNSSYNGPLSQIEYKVYKSDGAADASTQTEENANTNRVFEIETQDNCTRGVSTDDCLLESDHNITHQNQVSQVIKQTPEICRDFASSLSDRTVTLESLIREELRKLNNFRILEEEGFQMPSSMKLKALNMIMQLLSCGSISVKDHIPTYKPTFFSRSVVFGEIDCLAKNPHLMGMRLEDKEYFSGSLAEKNTLKEGVPTILPLSTKQLDSNEDEEGSSTSLKCIPRSINSSLSNQPRFPDSSGNDKENVIKIEES